MEAIKPTTDNCWVLADPQGRHWDNGDYVVHFKNRSDAEATATEDWAPLQFSERCTTVTCTCCSTVLDEDYDGHTVHMLPGEVADITSGYGWKATGDGWRCNTCLTGECEKCAPDGGQ